MKSIPLLVALSFSAPTAPATGTTVPPAEELPETPTRSGHEFLAHCSEDDFARARFPQKLARKCTALLELWRAEASGRGNRQGAPSSGVDGFGAPRGIPMIPPSAGPGG